MLEDKLEGELRDDDLELVHLGLGGSSIWMKMGNTLIVKKVQKSRERGILSSQSAYLLGNSYLGHGIERRPRLARMQREIAGKGGDR